MKKILFLLALIISSAAAFSQTIPVATQVTLSGSGTDVDGTISSYSWRQVSGPANPTIVSPNSASTVVKDYSVPGIYKYELTVTDNRGGIGKDTTQVTVLQAANIPPEAHAGSSLTIQLPQTSFNLQSAASSSIASQSSRQPGDALYDRVVQGLKELIK